MNHWDGVARWVNTALLAVVGVVGFDALFRLLEASDDNVIVALTRGIAETLLAPFAGMFGEDEFLLTAFVAVLGYALVAGVLLAAVRASQASLRGLTRGKGLSGRGEARRGAEDPLGDRSALRLGGFDTGPPGPASMLDRRATGERPSADGAAGDGVEEPQAPGGPAWGAESPPGDGDGHVHGLDRHDGVEPDPAWEPRDLGQADLPDGGRRSGER